MMKIGQLSRKTGVEAATIRYYEREGLIPSPTRTASGYRTYGKEAVERLKFIRHCRLLDMPLADVRGLLALSEKRAAPCEEVNRLIDAQLERVRAKRKELETLERQLAGLRARCETGSRVAECGIVGELMHAAHGKKCACHADEVKPR
jgi:Cd(II)/Pb(II)-responsive transcriptional regulator